MNFKIIINSLIILVVFQSFKLPRNIQKKVDKEIKMAFDVETYTLESIQVSNDMNKLLQLKITTDNFSLPSESFSNIIKIRCYPL